MKRLKNTIQQTKIFLIAALLSMISVVAFAQGGPPPPPSGDPDSNNSQDSKLGGRAPISGGLYILLGLGLVYGGRKLYQMREESKESLAD